MIPFSSSRRLWRIWRVYRRYGLAEALGKPVRGRFDDPIGVRLRHALEELGPVFIKFGQALSTRPDILPPEIAAELAKLQDQVTPFDGGRARQIIEAELGRPVSELFSTFSETPLASASIAQVHAATLKSEDGAGMEIVVKVVRPGIRARVQRDVDVMHALADLVHRFSEHAERLRPREVVTEFENVIFDELDMMREAANAGQLRRNWLGSAMIYHPIVLWDFCSDRVLTMERLRGVPVDRIKQMRDGAVDFEKLARHGVEIFFREVFYFNFFHADMHPGNVLVDIDDPANPRYLALDFGIVGSLTPEDQRYLAENFVAFFARDYRRVAELHIESGWVPRSTRVDAFTSAIRAVCEPIFNKPLSEISFGQVLVRLFTVAQRFNMTVQPQLVLLQKTILQIEGLGRQLYPELDLWDTAAPIMEQWMRDRLSPKHAFDQMKYRLPAMVDGLPKTLMALEARLDPQDARGFVDRTDMDRLRQDIQHNQSRTRRTLAGAALVISAALVFGLDGFQPAMLGDAPVLSWALGAAGVVAWWSAARR